jgi:hypothetical protein
MSDQDYALVQSTSAIEEHSALMQRLGAEIVERKRLEREQKRVTQQLNSTDAELTERRKRVENIETQLASLTEPQLMQLQLPPLEITLQLQQSLPAALMILYSSAVALAQSKRKKSHKLADNCRRTERERGAEQRRWHVSAEHRADDGAKRQNPLHERAESACSRAKRVAV